MLSILNAFNAGKKDIREREPLWFCTSEVATLFFVSRQSVDKWAKKENLLSEKFLQPDGRFFKKFQDSIIDFFLEHELSEIRKKENRLNHLKKRMDELLREPDPMVAQVKKKNLIIEYKNEKKRLSKK